MIPQVSRTSRDDADTVLAQLPYRLEQIRADRLEIGPRYQRSISQAHVNKIASHFDPFLLDDLLVNREPDGRLVVMDGQHRLLAIREMGYGDQNVPCKIYDALPEDLQARRFNVQDDRRRLSPRDRFRAALIAGDPDAHAVKSIVERVGFRLNLNDTHVEGGNIPGVAMLLSIYRARRQGTLETALTIIRDAFGTAEGPRTSLIEGVAQLITRYPDRLDHHRLVSVMRRTTINRTVTDGHDVSRVLGIGNGPGVAYYLWREYNQRLAGDRRLPDFLTSGGRGKSETS